eukprot:CAMPEP_0118637196 /NCGR_PEP_ID=MMETSP0785-20121206/3024_1 /TAXON_ID=91992 /ORGANISM="Bolidomonas pacifica, Strain CCMP 1866" /LENGTH=436 /DNA_ID=CAMNT_0006528367 /DNA_START=145 /DNA_END=1451 /DNA_ORIENTATION=+
MRYLPLLPSLAAWFLFSSLLSIYNKYIFGSRSFPYPLFMTSFHFLLQWTVSTILTKRYPKTFYNTKEDDDDDDDDETNEEGGEVKMKTKTGSSNGHGNASKNKQPPSFLLPLTTLISTTVPPLVLDSFSYITSGGVNTFPWPAYFAISIPIGLTSSLDISLSNVSLSLISLSTYVMIKSTVPVFVAFFAIGLGVERLSWTLVLVVGVISLGEVVTVSGGKSEDGGGSRLLDAAVGGGEEAFGSPEGVALCLAASMFSGLRWTLVQFLLNELPKGYKTPMVTLRLVAGVMWATTLFASFIRERPWGIVNTEYASSFGNMMFTLMVSLFGGAIAICMVMAEFSLILKSTAVVLMIGGVLKEIFTIVLGVLLFGDRLTGRNLLGFCIVLVGVIIFKFRHYRDEDPGGSTDSGKGGAGEEEGMEVGWEDKEDDEEMIELV